MARLAAPIAVLTLGCRLAVAAPPSASPATPTPRATETQAAVITDVPPTVAPTTTTVVSAHDRLVSSLDRLVGIPPVDPALPSYHLEFTEQAPVWGGSQVVMNDTVLSADVDGRNVHYTHRDTLTESLLEGAEVYLIGDRNYVVEDGEVYEGLGFEGMTWILWPVDAGIALTVGATILEIAGTDMVDGRSAQVYTISGSAADDPKGELSELGLPITAASGTVWVDLETGALLKLSADYEAMFVDAESGIVNGTGTGHIEILVTRVGLVEVDLPG